MAISSSPPNGTPVPNYYSAPTTVHDVGGWQGGEDLDQNGQAGDHRDVVLRDVRDLGAEGAREKYRQQAREKYLQPGSEDRSAYWRAVSDMDQEVEAAAAGKTDFGTEHAALTAQERGEAGAGDTADTDVPETGSTPANAATQAPVSGSTQEAAAGADTSEPYVAPQAGTSRSLTSSVGSGPAATTSDTAYQPSEYEMDIMIDVSCKGAPATQAARSADLDQQVRDGTMTRDQAEERKVQLRKDIAAASSGKTQFQSDDPWYGPQGVMAPVSDSDSPVVLTAKEREDMGRENQKLSLGGATKDDQTKIVARYGSDRVLAYEYERIDVSPEYTTDAERQAAKEQVKGKVKAVAGNVPSPIEPSKSGESTNYVNPDATPHEASMLEQYNELGKDALRQKLKATLEKELEAGRITGQEMADRINQLDDEIAAMEDRKTADFETKDVIDWSKSAAEKGDTRVRDGDPVK
jgi:hypothetical protein